MSDEELIGPEIAAIVIASVAALFLMYYLFRVGRRKWLQRQVRKANTAYRFNVGNKRRELAEGTTLIAKDQLRMGVRIGSSTHSDVFKGEYDGARVAIKKLTSSAPSGFSEELRQIMRTLNSTLLNLNHPSLVKYHGCVLQPPHVMLVHEFMMHESLARVVQDRSMDLRWSKRIQMALDAAKGLAYVHECGLVHGNVQTKNYLVGDKMSVKLGDLGVREVLLAPRDAEEPELCPLHFSAPELLKGFPSTSNSDVYSFGIVLYELITRQPAFPGRMPVQVAIDALRARKHIPLNEWPEDTPESLQAIVRSCMNPVAMVRPTMSEVVEQLEAVEIPPRRPQNESLWTMLSQPKTAEKPQVALVEVRIVDAALHWTQAPEALRDASIVFNTLVWRVLRLPSNVMDLIFTDGECFRLATTSVRNAVEWCSRMQEILHEAEWDDQLLAYADGDHPTQTGDSNSTSEREHRIALPGSVSDASLPLHSSLAEHSSEETDDDSDDDIVDERAYDNLVAKQQAQRAAARTQAHNASMRGMKQSQASPIARRAVLNANQQSHNNAAAAAAAAAASASPSSSSPGDKDKTAVAPKLGTVGRARSFTGIAEDMKRTQSGRVLMTQGVRGLAVGMAVHYGDMDSRRHGLRYHRTGDGLDELTDLAKNALGGQVLVSEAAWLQTGKRRPKKVDVEQAGTVKLKRRDSVVFSVTPERLKDRAATFAEASQQRNLEQADQMPTTPQDAEGRDKWLLTDDDLMAGGKCIGMGTFGVVYAVKRFLSEHQLGFNDSEYSTEVAAIKKLRVSFHDHIEMAHVRYEAVRTRLLGYPHLFVPFHGLFVDARTHTVGLVYDYMGSGNVSQAVRSWGFVALADKLKWGMQMVEALQVLHTQDPPIIHGSLSLRNMLLDDALDAHMMDFGFIEQKTEAKNTTSPYSISFIAPEMLLGGKPTLKSDLYALGIALYELFVGSQPYPELTAMEIATHVVNDARPQSNIIIDPMLSDLCALLWQRDPDARRDIGYVVDQLQVYREYVHTELLGDTGENPHLVMDGSTPRSGGSKDSDRVTGMASNHGSGIGFSRRVDHLGNSGNSLLA